VGLGMVITIVNWLAMYKQLSWERLMLLVCSSHYHHKGLCCACVWSEVASVMGLLWCCYGYIAIVIGLCKVCVCICCCCHLLTGHGGHS